MNTTNTIPNSLGARLEGYAATAAGQTASGRGLGEIAGYAAAAGAGLAMAGAADAAVIYSGVQNISVGIDPTAQATVADTGLDRITGTSSGTRIDLDGGGADLALNGSFFGLLFGSSTAKYGGGAEISGIGGATLLGTGDARAVGGANLAAGALIGADGAFEAGAAGRRRAAYYDSYYNAGGSRTSASTRGNFASGTTGFAGIRLGSGNYGWIRLRLDDLGPNQPFTDLLNVNGGFPPVGTGLGYPDRVTVIDWAYENSGAPIRAGEVPEPTPLALLAAGAAGIGAFRRRKVRPPASA